MPAAFVMELVCEGVKGVPAKFLKGRALQGMFLEAVRRVDSQIADSLHEGSGEKPYTLSLLERPRHRTQVRHFSLRVTLLNDDLFPLLLQLQSATLQKPLLLATHELRIQRIELATETPSSWVGLVSWEDLLERARPERLIRFELSTPTCFRQTDQESKHRTEIPVPLPSLLFGGALRRWERWSKLPLSPDIRSFFSYWELTVPLRLEAFELEHEIHGTIRNPIGSVGVVTYRTPPRKIPEPVLKQCNALANALFFTGAGWRTTLGMGRIRRTNRRM